MSKTISVKTKAWITSDDIGPADLRDPKNLTQLAYNSNEYMARYGWVIVGDAEITVEIADEQAMVASKVEVLRNQIADVRAKAHMEATRLEGQINDLLAISYEPREA